MKARWRFVSCLFFVFGLIISACFYPETSIAKVVINEVYFNPVGNDRGAEWVELYNTDNTPTPLRGCVLYLDSSVSYQKIEFSDEDFIDKFKVLSWSSSWLNNDGDTVKLVCGEDYDLISYGSDGRDFGKLDEGVSIGRSTDGTGEFSLLSSPTVGEPNSQPMPSPTQSLPNTPTPTLTNTPTPRKPTVTAEATPLPTPSPTRVSSASSPTTTPTTRLVDGTALSSSEGQIQGWEFKSEDANNNDKSISQKSGNRFQISAGPLLLVVFGVLLLFVAVVLMVRNYASSKRIIEK